MEVLLSSGQFARALGIQPYKLEYLIATGVVPDTKLRVAGKRAWSQNELDIVREILAAKQAGMPAKKKGA